LVIRVAIVVVALHVTDVQVRLVPWVEVHVVHVLEASVGGRAVGVATDATLAGDGGELPVAE
jgi:hypothetical protein